MKRVTISYAKNNLCAVLRQVREGAEVLVLDRTRPVARIYPVAATSAQDAGGDLVRRGIAAPPRRVAPRRNQTPLSAPPAARGGDILRALAEDREDRA